MRTYGERLRHALASRGMEKQMALAFDLGVHQSTISRWKESGAISLASACNLCERLDISLDWLMLGRGVMDQHTVRPGRAAEPDGRRRTLPDGLPPEIASRLLGLADAIAEDVQARLRPAQHDCP